MFPLSLINDYLYCFRRACLKMIDGVREANEHTLLGDLVHEHVDFPGYEQRAGWTLLRALGVYSDRLGVVGKADLVEVRRDADGIICEARPIEYKKGAKRKFQNDDAQLCAQAICLEEMFNITIHSGAIYHAKSERRSEVVFDEKLREKTLDAVCKLHAILDVPNENVLPPAVLKPQCEGCSLHEICLPEAQPVQDAARLYEPRIYD